MIKDTSHWVKGRSKNDSVFQCHSNMTIRNQNRCQNDAKSIKIFCSQESFLVDHVLLWKFDSKFLCPFLTRTLISFCFYMCFLFRLFHWLKKSQEKRWKKTAKFKNVKNGSSTVVFHKNLICSIMYKNSFPFYFRTFLNPCLGPTFWILF